MDGRTSCSDHSRATLSYKSSYSIQNPSLNLPECKRGIYRGTNPNVFLGPHNFLERAWHCYDVHRLSWELQVKNQLLQEKKIIDNARINIPPWIWARWPCADHWIPWCNIECYICLLSHIRWPQGWALGDIWVCWSQEAISSVQLTCVLAFTRLFIVGAPNDCHPWVVCHLKDWNVCTFHVVCG